MSLWSFRVPSANLAALVLGAALLLGAGPTGAIWVTTLPSGADVWLDGAYVGRSPLVVDALAAGEHKLTLTMTGWTPQDVTASVLPAQTVTTAVVLARGSGRAGGSGTVALVGARPATVTVDGEAVAVAKDGTLALAAGTHELAFAAPSGRTVKTVTVYPQMRTELLVTTESTPRSAVIAPVDDYLPAGAYRIDGTQLVVRYGGHDVVARIGATRYEIDRRDTSYDAAPTMINGRLYLPVDLLLLLNPTAKK
jgi:hypothetical protein